MFGGLEIKGGADKKKEEESSASAPATSGFSFLSPSSTSAAVPPPPPSVSSADVPAVDAVIESVPSSGFSFLKETKVESASALQAVEESSSDNTPLPLPSSGFSFLTSAVGSSTAATIDAKVAAQEDQGEFNHGQNNQSEEIPAPPLPLPPSLPSASIPISSVNPPASSGFSFLSSTQPDQPEDTPSPPAAPSTVSASNSANGSGSGSMFSILNLKTDEPPCPPIKSDAAPSITSSSEDILSHANPNANANPKYPTGSGIVFGGAAKPKVVKKRSRTKKIGANVAGLPPSIPKPSYVHTDIEINTDINGNGNVDGNDNSNSNDNGNVIPSAPEAMEHSQPQTPEEKRMFRKLTDEANQAATRAENFISSKQSSSYMGRYSNTDTIEEDYGDDGHTHATANGSGNGNTSANANTNMQGSSSSNKEDSEDYKKAKAIAQEAMKKETTLRKIGFSAGLSGFFKRSLGGSSHGSVAPEEEVAAVVVEKKEEEPVRMQVPTYGESNAPLESENTLESDHVVQERLRQEEERQTRNSEELKKKHRVEVEREEEDRKAEEQRRVEEVRMLELEQEVRKKEDHRRQEAEEAARRTPDQILQQILRDFSAKTQDATLAVAALRQEISTMQGKRVLAGKQERFAAQQISQAEKQQMEAAEQEDFELADQLAAVIEQHQREQEEKSQIFENIIGLIEDLDYKRLDVVKGVWKCFENIQKELKIFFAEQENSDIADGFEVMKKFENNSRKLAAVYERLSADLKNIERDDEFAKQEREELETNIHEQTFSIEDLRDVAIEKLDGINIEIDDLRRQLEAKEMDAAEIKLELHDHEDSIEQVRATFSRQLTRLAKKESAVNESRNEWDGEDTIYKKAREEHELEVTSHSEALIAHDRIICQVKEEILVADKLAKIIAQEVVVEKSKDPQDIDDELRMVQAEVLQLEAAADEATQGLAAAKASIDGLEEEISSIEVRLPILESEKKLSASKRDFRAAAKASKEMKELIARKDRYNEDLKGEASEKQEAASKAADEALEALNDKKAIAHIKEKESGSKRMIDLVKNIIKLEKLRESVCGIDEGEMDNIKSVGGFVLDSEMSALMMEGDELDQKYGGWNEIMLEYASKENDDEDDGTMAAEIELSSTESEQIMSTHDKDNDDCIESKDCAVDDEDIDSGVTKKAMVTYKTLVRQLDDLESKLELSIENEEYESATVLDDQIAALKIYIDSFALTDDEKEVALLPPSISDTNIEEPNEIVENCDDSKQVSIIIAGPSDDEKEVALLPTPMSDTDIEEPNEIVENCDDSEPAPIVIAGPSGAGKGTLIGILMKKFPKEQFGFSVSHTTRNPREGEVDGVHYNFSTVDSMKQDIDEGKFIEYANVHGNYYGTSIEAVKSVQNKGQVCILDIDVQGVRNVKKSSLSPYYVFICPPSMDDLEARLRGRGTEIEEDIEKRLANAQGEMDYGQEEGHFDKHLVNDDLAKASADLCDTVKSWFPHLEEVDGEEEKKHDIPTPTTGDSIDPEDFPLDAESQNNLEHDTPHIILTQTKDDDLETENPSSDAELQNNLEHNTPQDNITDEDPKAVDSSSDVVSQSNFL